MNKTPHKYANVIKAWADGENIQFRHNETGNWTDFLELNPNFNEGFWRIKPKQYSGKFRVSCHKGVPGFSEINIHVVHENQFEFEESMDRFLCWLTDVIEYDVEIPREK